MQFDNKAERWVDSRDRLSRAYKEFEWGHECEFNVYLREVTVQWIKGFGPITMKRIDDGYDIIFDDGSSTDQDDDIYFALNCFLEEILKEETNAHN